MQRGGLCFVGSKRYVKSNSKYLPDYSDKKESNYILYLDASNLYGWAMSECLPYKNLKFVDISKDTLSIIWNTSNNNDKRYIIECDLYFPEHAHNKLNEYPICPENTTPLVEWFSEYQQQLGIDNDIIKLSEKAGEVKNAGANKLTPHLHPHKNYVIHYRNLKFIHELGVEIGQIHRFFSFGQKPWLQPYIEFNTNKRKEAKNEFETDFF